MPPTPPLQIRLEDLFKPCPQCGGEGIVTEAGEPANLGEVDSTTGLAACKACDGTGGKITAAGDALRKFIKHLRRQGHI